MPERKARQMEPIPFTSTLHRFRELVVDREVKGDIPWYQFRSTSFEEREVKRTVLGREFAIAKVVLRVHSNDTKARIHKNAWSTGETRIVKVCGHIAASSLLDSS
jgi:hypothetical protein